MPFHDEMGAVQGVLFPASLAEKIRRLSRDFLARIGVLVCTSDILV